MCVEYVFCFAVCECTVTVCRSVYSAQLHETPQGGGGSRLGYKQARLGYFDMLNKLRHLQHSSCKFFERYQNIFKRDTGIKMNRFRTYCTLYRQAVGLVDIQLHNPRDSYKK